MSGAAFMKLGLAPTTCATVRVMVPFGELRLVLRWLRGPASILHVFAAEPNGAAPDAGLLPPRAATMACALMTPGCDRP
jgi:hypothetical protein